MPKNLFSLQISTKTNNPKVTSTQYPELASRVELPTSSLPRMRSTTELRQHLLSAFTPLLLKITLLPNHFIKKNVRKSGRRDSNPRPSAWKADALPTELLPQFTLQLLTKSRTISNKKTILSPEEPS